MKKIMMLLVVSMVLSGCSLMGTTEYSLKPIETKSGEIVCCEAVVYNSKDYQKLKFKFTKNTDGSMTVSLDEEGVSASDPAAVAAKNNTALLELTREAIKKVPVL